MEYLLLIAIGWGLAKWHRGKQRKSPNAAPTTGLANTPPVAVENSKEASHNNVPVAAGISGARKEEPMKSIKKHNVMATQVQSSKIKITEDFSAAFDVLENSTAHVFLTGKAGAGKSTFLDYFRNNTKKKAVVLAPTGVAAINVRGQPLLQGCFSNRTVGTELSLPPARPSIAAQRIA